MWLSLDILLLSPSEAVSQAIKADSMTVGGWLDLSSNLGKRHFTLMHI